MGWLSDGPWKRATDPSIPPGVVEFVHPDGRRDRYPLVEYGATSAEVYGLCEACGAARTVRTSHSNDRLSVFYELVCSDHPDGHSTD